MNEKAKMPKHRCQSCYILRRPQNLKIDSGGVFFWQSVSKLSLLKTFQSSNIHNRFEKNLKYGLKNNEVTILTQKPHPKIPNRCNAMRSL